MWLLLSLVLHLLRPIMANVSIKRQLWKLLTRSQSSRLTVLTFFHLSLHLVAESVAIAANGLSASLCNSLSPSWLDNVAPRCTDGHCPSDGPEWSSGWMYLTEVRFFKWREAPSCRFCMDLSDGWGQIWWTFNGTLHTWHSFTTFFRVLKFLS